MPRSAIQFLFAALILGCGTHGATTDADAGGDAPSPCDDKHQARNGACYPKFDSCDDVSVPILGGGCRAVGVPKEACAPGFSHDDVHATCEPKLPAAPCPAGQIAVPGDAACRDVSPCGTGTFGTIPVDPTTLYVDQAYLGGASDGSLAKPFTKVQDAIDAVKTPKTIVAIAAGTYQENVRVNHEVRLYGRCPSMVSLESAIADDKASAIEVLSPSEIHGIAATGIARGITVADVAATLDAVWVHDTRSLGISVQESDAAVVTLTGSLVEKCTLANVTVTGAVLVVEKSLIRDGHMSPAGTLGMGVFAQITPASGAGGDVTVRGSLLERNHGFGAGAVGSKIRVEGSVVRGTLPLGNGTFGFGVNAEHDKATKQAPECTVVSSLVEGNRTAGISAVGKATVTATVVRATDCEKKSGDFGFGIQVQQGGDLTCTDSVLDGNHTTGLLVSSGTLSVERTIVRDTQPRVMDGRFGTGISLQDLTLTADKYIGSNAVVHNCLVLRSHFCGVSSLGSDLKLQESRVADVAPDVDGSFGDGVAAASRSVDARAHVESTAVIIERATRAGTVVFGSDLVITDSRLACSSVDLDLDSSKDGTTPLESKLEDGGGNLCGCDSPAMCSAESHSLSPIPLP